MDVVVQNRFQIPPAQAGAILDGYKKYAIPMEMARYEPPLHHGIVLEEAILSVSYVSPRKSKTGPRRSTENAAAMSKYTGFAYGLCGPKCRTGRSGN
jgi:hypothetical protein